MTVYTDQIYRFLSIHRTRIQQVTIIVLCFFAFNSVLFSLQHSVSMPPDLRNRIIGARMLKDGLSPYFYEWHRGDTVRYYNLMGFLAPGNIHTSSATSTPFVHLLLRPLVDLNQMQFNLAWILLQYLALVGTALILYRRLGKPSGLIIATVTILLTYSTGWRHHVFTGQIYIVIALLAALIFYFATAQKSTENLLLVAVFATAAILIRPIFITFFVPFIFQYKKWWPYAASIGMLLLLWCIYAYFDPVQRLNWQEYFQLVKLHSDMHLNGAVELRGNYELAQFEGISYSFDAYEKAAKQVMAGVENSSAYIILQRLGIKVSALQLLLTGSISVGAMLLPLIAIYKKGIALSDERLFTLAFCVFYTFDFFSPVARFTYYFAIWLFPLLLFFTVNRNRYITLLGLLGLFLNIAIIPAVKMEHTLGQLLLLAALLLFVYGEDKRSRFSQVVP